METPASIASHLVSVIENESIFEAWAELDVDPLVDPLVVFFVSFATLGPVRSAGFPSPPDLKGAVETVIKWLRDGVTPAAAQRKLRRMQKWEWGAIVTDTAALAEELASRYELSEATPETQLDWARIQGGIVITCGVMPRGREM